MKQSKKLAIFGGVLIAAAGLANSSAFARDLTVVSWGGNYQDAQREIYFKPYAEKTGKPVLDEAWDGGFGVLQSKVKAGTPNWDVVQVEAEELALGCADGLFEKIDWDKMGGKDKFLPDAVNECGVGAIVWSTAIAYDGAKLAEGPTSWADFWNVEKFPGKRSLRKGAKYTLEFALLADGVKKDGVYQVVVLQRFEYRHCGRRASDIFGGLNVQGPPVRPVSDPALCALVLGLQSELA